MTATEFLLVQVAATVCGLYLFRNLLAQRWFILARVVLFVAAASFSFDYIANDRAIWTFAGDWKVTIIINPFENTIFAMTMAILLILLYLGWENRTPKINR